MTDPIDTANFIVPVGKHAGELITRVPVSYLRYVVREGLTLAPIAEAEIVRRGTILPDLDITLHAVDRASVKLRRLWLATQLTKDEGIATWLARMAAEALTMGVRIGDGPIMYLGCKFAFDLEGRWPLLKTVSVHDARRLKEACKNV